MSDKGDNTLHGAVVGWFILLVVFVALAWLFWYYNDVETRNVIRWIRYGEMWVIKRVLVLGEILGLYDGGYQVVLDGKPYSWDAGYAATPQYSSAQLNYQHLSFFTALTQQPLRIPILVLAVIAAIWVIWRGPNTHYRKKLGLEDLIERQAINFPVIEPFIDFNPGTQPPRPPGAPVPAELPSFAEALGPEEWLAYHSIPVPDGRVDEAAARAAFIKQLGGRWKGWQALAPYKQILLAAFCLKAQRKRNEADAMLGRLARCWSFKKGLKLGKDRKLLGEARAILRNAKMADKTLKICAQHAYETTALLGALTFARSEGGVLAPAQFVWLRGHDRALWYPLNNAGRQSFHIEALGAMSHYKVERMTKRPVPIPKVENAVQTISEYMRTTIARPIPPLDYTGSKKRGVKKAV